MEFHKNRCPSRDEYKFKIFSPVSICATSFFQNDLAPYQALKFSGVIVFPVFLNMQEFCDRIIPGKIQFSSVPFY